MRAMRALGLIAAIFAGFFALALLGAAIFAFGLLIESL
jgi:hypothetical protein